MAACRSGGSGSAAGPSHFDAGKVDRRGGVIHRQRPRLWGCRNHPDKEGCRIDMKEEGRRDRSGLLDRCIIAHRARPAESGRAAPMFAVITKLAELELELSLCAAVACTSTILIESGQKNFSMESSCFARWRTFATTRTGTSEEIKTRERQSTVRKLAWSSTT